MQRGNPAASDWGKALVLKDFTDSFNIHKPDSETVMRLLHDGKYLYLKAECRIPAGVAGVK